MNIPPDERHTAPIRDRQPLAARRPRPSAWRPRASRPSDDLTPQILVDLRSGYGRDQLGRDVFAGLTVAILAIPLSMAIAIGSGADPGQGLVTTIVAGLLISALGGSRFQIGGPAAAFIVVVADIVARHGMAALMTATFLAGVILIVAGLARIGRYISYVPMPVILGFTSAVGLLITLGQLKDVLGLVGDVPLQSWPRIKALWSIRETVNLAALGLGLLTIAIIAGFRRFAPRWPGMLIAVVAGSLTAELLSLNVDTIGNRFGPTLTALTLPHLPDLSPARISEVLSTSFTLAFLIGVESLLSAVAADAIAGTRHRSNAEIVGQGFANLTSPLFGGLPATGVIARTGTNIQAGAASSISGVLHAVFVLLSVLLLGRLTAYMPMPCLAAVLLSVAWRLIDLHAIRRFVSRAPRDDILVLAVTWLLTVFEDLNTAIAVGVVLASLLLMHRLAETGEARVGSPTATAAAGEERRVLRDAADTRSSPWRTPLPEGVRMIDVQGPLFFGQAMRLADVLNEAGPSPRVVILRMRDVPMIDATAIGILDEFAQASRAAGCRIIMSSLQPQPRAALHRFGLLRRNKVVVVPDGFAAVAKARQLATRA